MENSNKVILEVDNQLDQDFLDFLKSENLNINDYEIHLNISRGDKRMEEIFNNIKDGKITEIAIKSVYVKESESILRSFCRILGNQIECKDLIIHSFSHGYLVEKLNSLSDKDTFIGAIKTITNNNIIEYGFNGKYSRVSFNPETGQFISIKI